MDLLGIFGKRYVQTPDQLLDQPPSNTFGSPKWSYSPLWDSWMKDL